MYLGKSSSKIGDNLLYHYRLTLDGYGLSAS